MIVPRLLEKLSRRLFDEVGERQLFVETVLSANTAAPAILWLDKEKTSLFPCVDPASFQPEFVDRLAADVQAGKHEFHEEGRYYCLDLSSVFSASVLRGITPNFRPTHILDMCAAPGGKGIFAWRMFSPELLVGNEVVGKRIPALISNLQRCRIHPAIVTQQDSARLAEIMPQSWPLVLVDAPCSGQSLLLKGKPVPGCFHERTVGMNANRQKRILANAGKLIAPGGFLAYMTCTFAREENEAVLEWFLKKFPEFEAVLVKELAEHRSHLSEKPCYRLWPQQKLGAGGFAALLRYVPEGKANFIDVEQLRQVWRSGDKDFSSFSASKTKED